MIKTKKNKKGCNAPKKKPAASKSAGKKTPKSVKKSNTKQTKKSVAKNAGRSDGEKSHAKEEYPHFRKYKKSNHPALIVGEQKGKKIDNQGREYETDEYKYRKVMHNEKDGNSPNEKVEPNPNPKDQRPMYIGKRVRHDEKKNFGKKYPWKYPTKKNKK